MTLRSCLHPFCVVTTLQAWPATLRTVYGDHDRYETNYFKAFPGYYFSGVGGADDACRIQVWEGRVMPVGWRAL